MKIPNMKIFTLTLLLATALTGQAAETVWLHTLDLTNTTALFSGCASTEIG